MAAAAMMSQDAANTLEYADRQHSNHRSHPAPAHQFIWRSGIKLDMSISPDKRRHVQSASAQHIFMLRTGKWKREKEREKTYTPPRLHKFIIAVLIWLEPTTRSSTVTICLSLIFLPCRRTYTRLFIMVTVMQLLLSAFSPLSLHPWSAPTLINTLNNKEKWRVIKEMKGGLNINESEQGSGWQTQFDTEPTTLLKHNIQSHPIKSSQ